MSKAYQSGVPEREIARKNPVTFEPSRTAARFDGLRGAVRVPVLHEADSVAFFRQPLGQRVTPLPFDDLALFLEAVREEGAAYVLLDEERARANGFWVLEHFRSQHADMHVVVIMASPDVRRCVECLQHGASDVIVGPACDADIVASMERLSALRIARNARVLQLLTERERDVLNGLVCGFQNKAIASALGISQRTVEVHRARLMKKLGVGNLAELMRIAFDADLPAALKRAV